MSKSIIYQRKKNINKNSVLKDIPEIWSKNMEIFQKYGNSGYSVNQRDWRETREGVREG